MARLTFLDDPFAAGAQAARDVASLMMELKERALPTAEPTPTPSRAPAFAAFGAIAGAAAGFGNLGISLANSVKSSTDFLEIEFVNLSSHPVVVFNYKPKRANVSKVPQPLAQGETDLFLITHDSFVSGETSIDLSMKVGDSDVAVVYRYTSDGDPGRWRVTMGIDGSAGHDFPAGLQLFGATLEPKDSNNVGFSIYTSPIETKSGQIDLVFYDYAPPKP